MKRNHIQLFVAAAVFSAFSAVSANAQRMFATPEEAAKHLQQAAQSGDTKTVAEIFGPDYRDIVSPDPAKEKEHLARFSHAMSEHLNPVAESRDKVVLEIGTRKWPFPIPLRLKDGKWYFDTVEGKEEILNRRIGRDELHAIGLLRTFAKSAGKSQASGQPLHGYVFKDLSDANGAALLAYPEEYGKTGIMTFQIGKDGTVLKRDLGEETAKEAASITAYKPGPEWRIEDDPGILFKEAPAKK